MKKRGQVSLEYLAIFSFAIFLTIPLISIYFIQQNNIQADIVGARANKIANDIVDTSEEVFYMGSPAQKILRVNFPNYIQEVIVAPGGISFVIDTGTINFDIFVASSVNLTGNISSFEGLHVLVIKNEGGYVSIQEQ